MNKLRLFQMHVFIKTVVAMICVHPFRKSAAAAVGQFWATWTVLKLQTPVVPGQVRAGMCMSVEVN